MVSQKQKENWHRNTNWDLRVKVHELRNKGWMFWAIADKTGVSRQRAHQVWHKVKNEDIEYLKKMRDKHGGVQDNDE